MIQRAPTAKEKSRKETNKGKQGKTVAMSEYQ